MRDKSIYPNSNNFQIKLKSTVINLKEVVLKNCNIPNAIYNVNKWNNKFTFTVGIIDYNVVLVKANYDIVELCNEMKNKMNSLVGGFNVTNLQNKITITNATPFRLKLDKIFAKLIGFKENDPTISISFTSPNFVSLYSTRWYYLLVNEFTNNDENPQPCTGVIMNNVQYGGIRTNDNNEYIFRTSTNRNLNVQCMTISLYDENYNLVDFEGIDYFLEFQVCEF